MKKVFTPLLDDSSVWSAKGLTIENRKTEVVLYGDFEFNATPESMEVLVELIEILTRTKEALSSVSVVEEEQKAAEEVTNPFV